MRRVLRHRVRLSPIGGFSPFLPRCRRIFLIFFEYLKSSEFIINTDVLPSSTPHPTPHQKRRPTIRSNNNDRNKTSANNQGCSTTNPQNRLPAVLHGAHQPIRRNTSQKPTKPEPTVGPSETSQRSRSMPCRHNNGIATTKGGHTTPKQHQQNNRIPQQQPPHNNNKEG